MSKGAAKKIQNQTTLYWELKDIASLHVKLSYLLLKGYDC